MLVSILAFGLNITLATATAPGPVDPGVMRSRDFALDVARLMTVRRGDHVVLDLFDDVSIEFVVERADDRGAGRRRLVGWIKSDRTGSVILVLGDGVAASIIRSTLHGTYQIRYVGEGAHVVEQIDTARFPLCGNGPDNAVAPADLPGEGAGVTAGACDDGSTIDILVVYTPLVAAVGGGQAGVEAITQLAVAEANGAYANSIVATRLRLVHVEQVDYDEVGSYIQHLNRLTNPADGFMDEANALRDLYGADMVALLVSDGSVCGMAWIMQSNSPSFESLAFSVTTWACTVGNFTFAHEVGHNMGCAHDIAHGGNAGGVFSYSNGWLDPGEVFRTVMAISCPGGCPRVAHFSNPDVLYQGLPTGVPIGQPDEAHNAQTINITSFTVANFRCTDCNTNGIPDADELAKGTGTDCNDNGLLDTCDIADGTSVDCNANGLPDTCDLAAGTSLDLDGNGVPDECDCPANFDGDDMVGITDMLILLSQWGPCMPGCAGDVDFDGNVGITDFLALLAAWGPCP